MLTIIIIVIKIIEIIYLFQFISQIFSWNVASIVGRYLDRCDHGSGRCVLMIWGQSVILFTSVYVVVIRSWVPTRVVPLNKSSVLTDFSFSGNSPRGIFESAELLFLHRLLCGQPYSGFLSDIDYCTRIHQLIRFGKSTKVPEGFLQSGSQSARSST